MPAKVVFSNRQIQILCLIFITIGCARSMNPDIERGADYHYQEGYPDVRLFAFGFLNLQDIPIIQVTTDIVYGSLMFSNEDGRVMAKLDISIRVINQETGYTHNVQQEFEIDSNRELFEISEELFTYTEEIEVEPGEFSIVLSVTDKFADKEFIRQTEAYIPDPASNMVDLTAVRLSGKNLDMTYPQFAPLTTYNITSKLDSLKFDFQVTNNDSEHPLTIHSQLLHYKADLSPSASMSDRNPSPSQIEHKGIDFRDYSVKEETVRYIEQPGSVLIEFKFPLFDYGNYRFQVQTTDQDGTTHYKARDFAIRRDNFPTLLTSKELAEPLIYLMNRNEHRRMMDIEDPHELKETIDRFWLSNIGSIRRARLVINHYYDRVERANKLFTNFKEGWKTDRGRIFILFGSPWYTDKTMNTLSWSYTHNISDNEYNFSFYQPTSINEFFPFEHYILERRRGYHQLEYRQQQLWLTGSIIERPK